MSAFYVHCSLTDRNVFASFPTVPVSKGLQLLNSPEQWASGACLAVGVPRFQIRNVSQVMQIHNERIVHFYANDAPVTLVRTTSGNRVTVRWDDKVNVQMNLNHDTSETGFSLYMTVTGLNLPLQEESLDDIQEWTRLKREWMELVLFSLVDSSDVQENERFKVWRSGI